MLWESYDTSKLNLQKRLSEFFFSYISRTAKTQMNIHAQNIQVQVCIKMYKFFIHTRIYQNFDFTFLPGVICNTSTPSQMSSSLDHKTPITFIHTRTRVRQTVQFFCVQKSRKISTVKKIDWKLSGGSGNCPHNPEIVQIFSYIQF